VTELSEALRVALASREEIQRDEVLGWCRAASDVASLHLLYRLTGEEYDRVRPQLGQQDSCELIQKYLLACVRLDPSEDDVFTRYEAAWTLVTWFQHLSSLPEDTTLVLGNAVAEITKCYLEGDNEVKLAIENGFLEHVFEEAELRPLFSFWQKDDRLRAAWQGALAWGEEHPNFTSSLKKSSSLK